MSPQTKDKYDLLLNRIERYGLSLMLLLSLVFWLAPKFDRMFDKHLEFMGETQKTLKTQADTQAVGVQMLKQIDTTGTDNHRMLSEIHTKIVANKVSRASGGAEMSSDVDTNASSN